MTTFDSVRFDPKLIAGWIKDVEEANAMAWLDDDLSRGGHVLLKQYFDRRITLPIENLAELRNACRGNINRRGGGLVSCDLLPLKVPTMKVIEKVPQEPAGMSYEGVLGVCGPNSTYIFRVICSEQGTTGMRDNAVLAMCFSQGLVQIDLETREMIGWSQDPYDPRGRYNCMPNLSEDESYDAQFPDHPLTRCRAFLKRLEQSLIIDDVVAGIKQSEAIPAVNPSVAPVASVAEAPRSQAMQLEAAMPVSSRAGSDTPNQPIKAAPPSAAPRSSISSPPPTPTAAPKLFRQKLPARSPAVGSGDEPDYYDTYSGTRTTGGTATSSSSHLINAKEEYKKGKAFRDGDGVAKDIDAAIKHFRIAAEHGDVDAQYDLGVIYEDGILVKQNYDEAAKWYRMGVDLNDIHCKVAHACLMENTNRKKEAFELFKEAAEQGVREGISTAASNFGRCHMYGIGCEKNYPEAVKWLKAALDINDENKRALYMLACCYYNGDGVEVDLMRAADLYRRAGELGHIFAQYEMGKCYLNGKGVKQNRDKAIEWFKKAADAGDEDAAKKLAELTG